MTVTKIIPERETRKMNLAAYARVSTLTEEQEESFETQVAYYTALIRKTEQWNFAGVYADHGKPPLRLHCAACANRFHEPLSGLHKSGRKSIRFQQKSGFSPCVFPLHVLH